MNKFKRMMIARGYWEEAPSGEATGGGSDGGATPWIPPETFSPKEIETVQKGLSEMDDAFGPADDETPGDIPAEADEPAEIVEDEIPVTVVEEDKRTDEEKAADETRAHPPTGDINKIPKSWKAGLAEDYAKLPENVKAEIHRREENFFQGLEKMRPAVDFAVEMDQAIRPFAPILEQQKATPEKAVSYLFSVYSVLTQGTPEQRLQGIKHLMGEAKVSIEALQGLPEAESAFVDPAVAELRGELNGVKSELQQRKEAEQAALRKQAETAFDTFVTQNPLANEVMEDMLPLIRAGMTLEQAFERAKWANPVVRAKLQKEQDDLAKAEEAKKNAAKTARARQAARTAVRDNSRSGGPTAPLGSIDDTMAEVVANIKSRS